MGKDVFEAYSAAKDVFETANDILGFDLAGICFEGPEEKLKETRYTQPAILAHSVAMWRIVADRGVRPDFVAGHSVGEYSALVAAGALAFSDAVSLVRIRAQAMFSSGEEQPGAMAAVIGVPEGNLDGFLGEARQAGIIEPANYNSPVQVVISGDVAAVDKAVEVARAHGAKRAIKLKVSGAFHSPLMRSAEEELATALESVTFSEAEIPVIANVTGRSVTQPEEISALLRRQLTSPVLWQQSMRYLLDQGVASFTEVGPGGVLCGLLKRIEPEARCVPCSDRKGVESFLKGVTP
jgi:[acyl-carrier-protein] S-malonyltransferase